MFVRGDEQSKAVQEMQSADNPDEIDISDDEDDEEEEGGDDGEYSKATNEVKSDQRFPSGEPPKKKEKVAVEEMDVPDKVFGGLKKPTAD